MCRVKNNICFFNLWNGMKIWNKISSNHIEFPNVLCLWYKTFGKHLSYGNWNLIKIISCIKKIRQPNTILCHFNDINIFWKSKHTRSLLILFWAFVIVSYLCLTRFNTVINVVDQVPPVMNYDYVVKDLLTFF